MDTVTLIREQPLPVQTLGGALLHRFTADDYEKLIAQGVLTPEDRVELLDGYLIDKMPRGSAHANALGALGDQLALHVRGRWVTQNQAPIQVAGPGRPEPDVVLLRPPRKAYWGRRAMPSEIFLAIEVSESSLELDRGWKLRAYARSGISEYWIVNLPERVVEVHRQPNLETECYNVVFRVGLDEQLAPEQFPDAVLTARDILPSGE